MKKQWIQIGLIATLVVSLLAGCGQVVDKKTSEVNNFDSRPKLTYNKDHYPVTIQEISSEGKFQDMVYKEPPQRIVAVWQSSVETLIALGVGDRIMAGMGIPDVKYLLPQNRATYEKIPTTSIQNLSVESVLAMKPDFIFGWYSTFQPKVLKGTDFWLERGVNTYISPASTPRKDERQTLDNEYKMILDLGKIFDRQEKAEAIVNEMKSEINQAVEYTNKENVHPKALIMEFSGKDIAVYDKKSLAGDILTTLHGELLGDGLKMISREQILELNPDVMFIVVVEDDYANPKQFFERVYNDSTLAQVKAIKEHRVYILPLYAVYSAGIRSLDGIRIISGGLYPNLKLDLPKEFAPDPKVMEQFNETKK